MSFILETDNYKLDHRRQYPSGTQYVYSTWTPRASRVEGQQWVVNFGLQYMLRKFMMEHAQATFFSQPKQKILDKYRRYLDHTLPGNDIGVEHIGALHDLGYIPLLFKALPEGMKVPLRIPLFTVENTHPEFFWVTNYFETPMSDYLWLPTTSATTAARFRRLFQQYAFATGGKLDFVPWQGHDFSMRGMVLPEGAALSGAGHLLSFTGSDTIPAIELLDKYYYADMHDEIVGGSVPATEHSVMCAGGKESELETFRRILKLYPKGVVSIVSDTWNLWKVIGEYLPALKDEIMARDGKVVIRPDSGDPVDILTGNPRSDDLPIRKGVVECLWDLFGGTVNAKGFKELDSHIGVIYGDSINEERANKICLRLMHKDFASTNWVAGIGSYTYQYTTRDTYGFAMKATWAQINGQEHLLYKDPVTDNGEKRSAKGRVVVVSSELADQGLLMLDGLTTAKEKQYQDNLLQPVWQDGQFIREWSLSVIRQRVQS